MDVGQGFVFRKAVFKNLDISQNQLAHFSFLGKVFAMPQKQSMVVSQERDFTGGMTHAISCSFVGTTGEKDLDAQIMELARSIHGVADPCLLAEAMTSAIRASRGSVPEADMKLMNRTMKEMRMASEVFQPYHAKRKVSVFGSARTEPDEPEYLAALDFCQKMTALGYMTITGAGPGIMAAGNEGAGRENSFGLNITLPFEAAANDFIANDAKLIHFNYFFTRKLVFVKEADAAVGFPGGFGTMDEVFEALTLIQTGKATVYPIVLVDAKGGRYWKFWDQFMREHLLRLKLISESDFSLYKVTDDVDEAVAEIVQFYKNFNSYRYIGDRVVIRLNKMLSSKALHQLSKDFADIIKVGEIEACQPFPEEANEPELKDFPRIVFRHKRRSFGRFRELIDALNLAETEA